MKAILLYLLLNTQSDWTIESQKENPIRYTKWLHKKECNLWVKVGYNPNTGKVIKYKWAMFKPKK